MIYGTGVSSKFNVILEGRRKELEQLHSNSSDVSDMLMTFRDEVRCCSMAEFNQWYDLYSTTYKQPTKRRPSILERLQHHDE